MKIRRLLFLSLGILLVLLGYLGRRILPGTPQSGSPTRDFILLRSVANLIRNDYVEARDPDRTLGGAYRGLVNSLDPLSAYLDPPALAAFDADRRSRFKETGIVLYKRGNVFPLVIGVVPGSPAEAAGIKSGDTLSAVDNRSTLDMSLVEVRLALRSADGTPVKARVVQDTETKDLPLERKALEGVPAGWSEEPGGPAIVSVRTLDGAAAQLRGALADRLKAVRGTLVLDLRLATEGSLAEGLKLANVFLKAADAGVLEKREAAKESLSCSENPLVPAATPLVVWTGPGTIGASEAVAGLLQEAKRARVVGVKTPGLASRQSVFRLEDGSGLILTTGYYVLPSGRKLWDEGIAPDAALGEDGRDTAAYIKTTKGLPAGS